MKILNVSGLLNKAFINYKLIPELSYLTYLLNWIFKNVIGHKFNLG